jgi:hypothetical protein
VTKRVEARIAKLEGVDHVTTWVGSGVPRFYLPLDQIFPQSNVSQLIVLPKDLSRASAAQALPELLADEFPRRAAASSCCRTGRRCRTRCSSASSGPIPQGARLRRRGEGHHAQNPNMRGVNDNWNESVKSLRLESTRTRRARSACPARRSRRRRARSTAARRSASTATATS